jgi:hypothetical protein
MPPRPLSPTQARASLAQRLGRVADRARQVATRLGGRPYRCWLTWTKWTGDERGQGNEINLARAEILPTPLVKSLDSVSFSIFHAGVVPAGSFKVEEISVASFSEDNLRGLAIPRVPWLEVCCPGPVPSVADLATTAEATVQQPFDFFWEVVEDGRTNPVPERKRFRLLSNPTLRAEDAMWTVLLERESPDRLRGRKGGESPFAPGSGR